MRRHKWKLLALAGLVVLAGIGAFALWPRPDRVTRENYARIRVGMSRAEAYAVLGPPGDYTTGDVEPSAVRPPVGLAGSREGPSKEQWTGDRAVMALFFDGAGNVADGVCFMLEPVDHGPFGNAVWRAKRLWRRWFP